MKISKENLQSAKNSLEKKGALRDCARCGGSSFTLLESYFKFEGQQDLQSTVLGGSNVPAYGVHCDKCGNLSFHAVKSITPNAF